jgi:hypothetical protein
VAARRATPPAVTAAQESHSGSKKRFPPSSVGLTEACATGRPPATAKPTPVTTGTAARDRSPQNRSRYRSIRKSRIPSRRKNPSWDVSPGIRGPAASHATPAVPRPAPIATAAPIRPAAVSRHRPPARRTLRASGIRTTTTGTRTTRPTTKNTRWVSPAAPRSAEASATARQDRPAIASAATADRKIATMATLASQPPARYAVNAPVSTTASKARSSFGPRAASTSPAAARPTAPASSGPRSVTVARASVPRNPPRARVSPGTPGPAPGPAPNLPASAARASHGYTTPSGPMGSRCPARIGWSRYMASTAAAAPPANAAARSHRDAVEGVDGSFGRLEVPSTGGKVQGARC